MILILAYLAISAVALWLIWGVIKHNKEYWQGEESEYDNWHNEIKP
jgi:hypothetical protein